MRKSLIFFQKYGQVVTYGLLNDLISVYCQSELYSVCLKNDVLKFVGESVFVRDVKNTFYI